MADTTRRRTRTVSTDKTTHTKTAGQTVEHDVTFDKHPEARSVVFPGLGMARLSVRHGVTINMGEFNSYRREVGLSVDVDLGEGGGTDKAGALTDEAVDILNTAHDAVLDWLEENIEGVVADAQEFFE